MPAIRCHETRFAPCDIEPACENENSHFVSSEENSLRFQGIVPPLWRYDQEKAITVGQNSQLN